jgi:hypothetical protein
MSSHLTAAISIESKVFTGIFAGTIWKIIKKFMFNNKIDGGFDSPRLHHFSHRLAGTRPQPSGPGSSAG